MSFAIADASMQRGPKGCAPRALLNALGSFADDFGFTWCGQRALAERVQLEERTVRRLVPQLEEDGWLTVYHKALNGRSDIYQINLERLLVTVTVEGVTKLDAIADIVSGVVMEALHQVRGEASARPATPQGQERGVHAVRRSQKSAATADMVSGVKTRKKLAATPDMPSGNADIVSGVKVVEAEDNPPGTPDNSQPRSGHPVRSHRTLTPLTPDIDASDISEGIYQESVIESVSESVTAEKPSPTPPVEGCEKAPCKINHNPHTPWGCFYYALRASLRDDAPILSAQVSRRFAPLIPGEEDWDAGFADAHLEAQENTDGQMVWRIEHPRPEICERFLVKYARRVEAAMRETLNATWQITVRAEQEAA